jgi:hypothetical protein
LQVTEQNFMSLRPAGSGLPHSRHRPSSTSQLSFSGIFIQPQLSFGQRLPTAAGTNMPIPRNSFNKPKRKKCYSFCLNMKPHLSYALPPWGLLTHVQTEIQNNVTRQEASVHKQNYHDIKKEKKES